MLKGLYAITDERLTPYPTLLKQIEEVLKGGARIVQFRHKSALTPEAIESAKRIRTLCHRYDALFIVNDHLDLALRVDADGLHVGREDARDLPAMRDALGSGKILGVSCYGEIARAVAAERAGADYVAFGAFFPSATKPNAPLIDLSVLCEAKRVVALPLCAIGGITLHNAPALIQEGADMLSVIGALWRAHDPRLQARRFAALFTNPAPETETKESSPERRP